MKQSGVVSQTIEALFAQRDTYIASFLSFWGWMDGWADRRFGEGANDWLENDLSDQWREVNPKHSLGKRYWIVCLSGPRRCHDNSLRLLQGQSRVLQKPLEYLSEWIESGGWQTRLHIHYFSFMFPTNTTLVLTSLMCIIVTIRSHLVPKSRPGLRSPSSCSSS